MHIRNARIIVHVITILTTTMLSTGAFCLTAPAGAQTRPHDNEKVRLASRQSEKAAKIFEKIMNQRDRSIPKELLDNAEAVAVFPSVVKAAFVVGGRGGRGVISRRIKGGWGPPALFNLVGASFGLQIGAAKTDYILLFMNEGAVKSLLKDKVEIGGEGSIAAGPVGRAASASTDARLTAGILSYSRSKGIFAGLELKGVVINPDNDSNQSVYSMSAKDILTGEEKLQGDQIPPGVLIFPQTLTEYSKR